MKALVLCLVVCLPLKILKLTSPYGWRKHPITGKNAFHSGVDLRAHSDTVFAVISGRISAISHVPEMGIHIMLLSGKVETIYGHLSRVLVLTGQPVMAGDPIAITGKTGEVTGEHLHFSIRSGNCYMDPLKFIYKILINNKNHE